MFKNVGGNIPGGNFLGGNFPGGTFPGRSLMGWTFPGWGFHGGSFPDTFQSMSRWNIEISFNSKHFCHKLETFEKVT